MIRLIVVLMVIDWPRIVLVPRGVPIVAVAMAAVNSPIHVRNGWNELFLPRRLRPFAG